LTECALFPKTVFISRETEPMRKLLLVLLIVAAGSGAYFGYDAIRKKHAADQSGPATAIDPSLFSGSNAFEYVKDFVAVGPRVSGTEGAGKAAEFLVARIKDIGLQADISLFQEQTPVGKLAFKNVTTTLKGSNDNIIVVVSHFDTKLGLGEKFMGANDSGSSTGLLLELARVLAATKRDGPAIMLAFVDGEECKIQYGPNDGFHGSRFLAAHLCKKYGAGKVKGVIVADMIGDRNLNVMIPSNSDKRLIPLVLDAAREENQRTKFSLRDPVGDDHVSFMALGIPAVDLIDFEYGSAPGKNDYWHTTADTLDKLSPESLDIVGKVVIRLINKLSR
jgi:glutaminyl-peptide cyclotransferase